VEVTDAVIGVVLAALIIALLGIGIYMINSYYVGTSNTITKATTLTAVVRGENHWYIEVVWAGPVFEVKYIVLSGGVYYPAGQAVLVKCGIAYYPAPYHYCIYELSGSLPMPIGVLGH
jgi:hypothetical protein